MRESNEAIRSYLLRDDLPEDVTVLDGDELRAFGEMVSAATGEPLKYDATVVKIDRSERGIAAFIFIASILGLGLIVWYLWHNEADAYVNDPHMLALPGILLTAISGIAFFLILRIGFSDLWLIFEEDEVRFRTRRFIRYCVENFPLASIEEIAIEIFPASPRHGELARLVVVLNSRLVELFRGQVQDAENGGIAFAAGLLGAATGLPVTRRRLSRFWENPDGVENRP